MPKHFFGILQIRRLFQLKAQLDTEFSWTLVVCVLLVRLIIVGPPLNFNLLYVEFRGLFLYHPYTGSASLPCLPNGLNEAVSFGSNDTQTRLSAPKLIISSSPEIIGGLNKISGHLASPALMALVLRYKALRLITFLGKIDVLILSSSAVLFLAQ